MNVKDTIVLEDDKEYVVVGKAPYEGKEYYYLVDIDTPTNLMFGYQDGKDFIETTDKDLTAKLLPLFIKTAEEEIDK